MANQQENRIYIGNLPFSTTSQELRDFFKGYVVVAVNIPLDRETNKPRGFAFVEFESVGMADGAVTNFDGQELGGRALKISIARPREERSGSNGSRRHDDRGRDNRGGGRGRRDRDDNY